MDCNFCLLITDNLSKCGLCIGSTMVLCDRCFKLHIDFHPLDDDILASVKTKRICGLDCVVGDSSSIF